MDIQRLVALNRSCSYVKLLEKQYVNPQEGVQGENGHVI